VVESYESIIEKQSKTTTIIRTVILILFLFFTIFPLLWIFLTSLKGRLDIFAIPPRFIFTPTFENYRGLFVKTFLEGSK